jgi:hypothetical protein
MKVLQEHEHTNEQKKETVKKIKKNKDTDMDIFRFVLLHFYSLSFLTISFLKSAVSRKNGIIEKNLVSFRFNQKRTAHPNAKQAQLGPTTRRLPFILENNISMGWGRGGWKWVKLGRRLKKTGSDKSKGKI